MFSLVLEFLQAVVSHQREGSPPDSVARDSFPMRFLQMWESNVYTAGPSLTWCSEICCKIQTSKQTEPESHVAAESSCRSLGPTFSLGSTLYKGLPICRLMGSLGLWPRLADAKCPGDSWCSNSETSVSPWDAPSDSPNPRGDWDSAQAVISSFSVARFLSRAQHHGISLKPYVLTSLSSPLNLPGARLSSRLLAKRHLLKYSSAEIVPWVLFPICPVVCH